MKINTIFHLFAANIKAARIACDLKDWTEASGAVYSSIELARTARCLYMVMQLDLIFLGLGGGHPELIAHHLQTFDLALDDLSKLLTVEDSLCTN